MNSLDRDIPESYGAQSVMLNCAGKRNLERLPRDFRV